MSYPQSSISSVSRRSVVDTTTGTGAHPEHDGVSQMTRVRSLRQTDQGYTHSGSETITRGDFLRHWRLEEGRWVRREEDVDFTSTPG